MPSSSTAPMALTAIATASSVIIALILRKRRRATHVKSIENAPLTERIGFIFDLDGTLLDFEGSSHLALNAPLEKFGKHVDWSLHASIVGKPAHYWTKEILRALQVEHLITADEYSRGFHDYIKKSFPNMQLMPGALSFVKRLKAKYPDAGFAIATSSERHSFDVKMSYHPELVACFDAVVTGNEIPNGKPNPDIFLEAARRLGVLPHRCAVFEDAPSGAQAGRRAGATVIAIPDDRMIGNESAFTFVDFQLRSLEEINDLLLDDILARVRTRPAL